MSKWIDFAIIIVAVALIGFFLYKNMNNTQTNFDVLEQQNKRQDVVIGQPFLLKERGTAIIGNRFTVILEDILIAPDEEGTAFYNLEITDHRIAKDTLPKKVTLYSMGGPKSVSLNAINMEEEMYILELLDAGMFVVRRTPIHVR